MSTQEIISHAVKLSPSDKIILLETILNALKLEVASSANQKKEDNHKNELLRRRKAFKVDTFDLGCDVVVDRDELYAERGF